MANLISDATGNWSSSSTWGVAEAATGAAQVTRSASTTTTTSYVYSSAFTVTNLAVIDGVLVHVKRSTTTGTFSVALSDDNGVTATREVTINANDLGAEQSWVFFKFGSPLTGDGGTDYKVGIKGSSAGNVTVYRDATAGNWARLLRTTTTGAPAANDNIYVVGEWTAAATGTDFTVTMDSTTATDYGTLDIGDRGILTWGTTAATNYVLQLSGDLNIWDGGTYNQGTVATPMPRDSTATLQFDCTSDGQFGLIVNNAGTCVLQGLSRTSGKNVDRCKLNTDEAAASTSLGVDTDTGWLDNDRIAIAATTRTATECETGLLNGNAGASTLTVGGFGGAGGGLASAKKGTDNRQAEIILLTRNVVVTSVSTTNMSYVNAAAGGNLDADWCEFRYLGENATNKRGVELATTTGVVTMDFCSIWNCEDGGLYLSGTSLAGSITINDLVMYNCANVSGTSTITVLATSGVPQFARVIVIRNASTSVAVTLTDIGLVFAGLTVAGAAQAGVQIFETLTATEPQTGISDIVVHSCGGAGFTCSGGAANINSITCWRNGSVGISVTAGRLIVDSAVLTGNTTGAIQASASYLEINQLTAAGETGFNQALGAWLSAAACGIVIRNGDFGTATGIFVGHTTGDIGSPSGYITGYVRLENCKLSSTNETSGLTSAGHEFIVTSQRHDQTNGDHRFWRRSGAGRTDATIYNTAAPSERLTPAISTVKLSSGSRLAAVDNSGTRTVSVWVRKSQAGDGAAYNGNQPRLIVKRNDALGITSDTVLDTMTASAGTWEQLTGTTAAASDDGAFEFVVDCDGTAGWINVDDWSVT